MWNGSRIHNDAPNLYFRTEFGDHKSLLHSGSTGRSMLDSMLLEVCKDSYKVAREEVVAGEVPKAVVLEKASDGRYIDMAWKPEFTSKTGDLRALQAELTTALNRLKGKLRPLGELIDTMLTLISTEDASITVDLADISREPHDYVDPTRLPPHPLIPGATVDFADPATMRGDHIPLWVAHLTATFERTIPFAQRFSFLNQSKTPVGPPLPQRISGGSPPPSSAKETPAASKTVTKPRSKAASSNEQSVFRGPGSKSRKLLPRSSKGSASKKKHTAEGSSEEDESYEESGAESGAEKSSDAEEESDSEKASDSESEYKSKSNSKPVTQPQRRSSLRAKVTPAPDIDDEEPPQPRRRASKRTLPATDDEEETPTSKRLEPPVVKSRPQPNPRTHPVPKTVPKTVFESPPPSSPPAKKHRQNKEVAPPDNTIGANGPDKWELSVLSFYPNENREENDDWAGDMGWDHDDVSLYQTNNA